MSSYCLSACRSGADGDAYTRFFSPAATDGNDWNMSGCLGRGDSLQRRGESAVFCHLRGPHKEQDPREPRVLERLLCAYPLGWVVRQQLGHEVHTEIGRIPELGPEIRISAGRTRSITVNGTCAYGSRRSPARVRLYTRQIEVFDIRQIGEARPYIFGRPAQQLEYLRIIEERALSSRHESRARQNLVLPG